MTNFRIKVKINDYFSKIDAIPYDNYICVITCNNCYSIIKLTEHNYQIFQHSYKLIKNMDLLFNLKLINYVDNTLVGMYDLIIPHSKINQISQKNKSIFKHQIKLIMNSNVKIKLFDYLMNIPNIFLDLIFEFSLIDNYSNSIRNKANQRKISDLLGISEYGNHIKLNVSDKIGFNTGFNNNGQIPKKTISFSKSPVLNYNNTFMHNIYGNGFNNQKENIIEEKSSIYMKTDNKSDINYNVMNNNYLNYFKIDNNNNFPLNYKYNISNNLHKNNIESLNQYGNNEIYININNLNNSSTSKFKTDVKNGKKFIKINNDNYINEKKRQMKNKLSRSPQMNLERRLENEINSNYSNFKNLSEVKNSFESSVIRSEKKKLELNQNKKNLKFQNWDNKLNNNFIAKGNYVNYINNNKPFSNDKKNNNEKYFSNKLIRKIPNNKTKINERQNLNYNIGLNALELPNNKLTYSQIKTPKKLRKSYLTENNPFTISTSSRNNIKEEKTDINEHKKKIKNNNIYINDESNNDKTTSHHNNNHNKQRINYNKIKTSVIQTKTEPKINILGKKYESNNITDFNDYDNDNGTQITSSLNKKNIFQSLSEDNKNRAEQEDNLVPEYTQEEVRDKIIQIIDNNNKLKKEIKENIFTNMKLMKKLILCKSQYYTELKINNLLNNKINDKNIKYSIHVNVHSKLNEKIYFNMRKIKLKESKIFEKIFYEHKNSPEYKATEAKKKIQEKFEQQKKVHALLKIIRELIQKYDNLSQMYDNDEKKKLLFKSLLVRYGIREKEADKENNLNDKFKEIQKKIEDEKNKNFLMMKKQEMQGDVYKNVIKEEDSESKSSTSERIKMRMSLKKKLSWNSEDSVLKEKDSTSNNNDINNSVVSSGLKIIKERNEEEFIKDNENKDKDKDNDNKEDKNEKKDNLYVNN